MFSNGRFMNGASTNPDLTAFSWACAKTKKSLDAGLQLGAENHVFWGGREGYQVPAAPGRRKGGVAMSAILRPPLCSRVAPRRRC